jgi:biopolymer transport protein ExbD
MRKARRHEIPPVNVTPLVDVLLILVVVLLLAMPLYVKRLPIDLPTTSLAGAPTPVEALPIALQKDATLFVRETPLPLDTVLTKIDQNTTIELSVDKDTTYETIAKLIAKLQEKNPKEIVLITR